MVESSTAQLSGYVAHCRVTGTQALLFSRSGREVEDPEAQVYRSAATRTLAMPAEQFRLAISQNAPRLFHRDTQGSLPMPEGVRWGRLAQFMYENVSLVSETGNILLSNNRGRLVQTWDGIDERYVTENGERVKIRRPFLRVGWSADLTVRVANPESIPTELLSMLIVNAGTVDGVGSFRQKFGGFTMDPLFQPTVVMWTT